MDNNVPSWDEYFMKMVKTISIRSKDPNTKVGCVIVDNNNHIIATGYNGFPSGFGDTEEKWQKPTKYDFVVHAEANALLNSIKPVKGCNLYSTMYPCANCAKHIAAAGIKRVYFEDDKYKNKLTKEIFHECGIECVKI